MPHIDVETDTLPSLLLDLLFENTQNPTDHHGRLTYHRNSANPFDTTWIFNFRNRTLIPFALLAVVHVVANGSNIITQASCLDSTRFSLQGIRCLAYSLTGSDIYHECGGRLQCLHLDGRHGTGTEPNKSVADGDVQHSLQLWSTCGIKALLFPWRRSRSHLQASPSRSGHVAGMSLTVGWQSWIEYTIVHGFALSRLDNNDYDFAVACPRNYTMLPLRT